VIVGDDSMLYEKFSKEDLLIVISIAHDNLENAADHAAQALLLLVMNDEVEKIKAIVKEEKAFIAEVTKE